MVTGVANGYVMGKSVTAPNPYVTWKIDHDGKGVSCGHYFNDREEAEWDFCARAFEWFEDNVNIHMIEDDESAPCEGCRYNTNDYVCHPICGGCDGQSKFESKKPLGLIGGLKTLRTDLEKAARFVDELCAEVDKFKQNRGD